jgi:hypothetical protein
MNYLVRRMITIKVTQKILAPVEQVCQVLLDHQQLDRFFNAQIALVKNQNDGELIGGKGAVRRISIGKIVFEEEVVSASFEHICYRIIGSWPVSDHQGDIRLIPKEEPQKTPKEVTQVAAQTSSLDNSNSTQLDYVIKFNGPKWLPDFLLKFFVGRDIVNAMKKLAEHFAAEKIA